MRITQVLIMLAVGASLATSGCGKSASGISTDGAAITDAPGSTRDSPIGSGGTATGGASGMGESLGGNGGTRADGPGGGDAPDAPVLGGTPDRTDGSATGGGTGETGAGLATGGTPGTGGATGTGGADGGGSGGSTSPGGTGAADGGAGSGGGEVGSSIDGSTGSGDGGGSMDAAAVKFGCGPEYSCTLGSEYCATQDPSTYLDPYSYDCKQLPAGCGARDCSCLCPNGSCPPLLTGNCRCTTGAGITVECIGE